MEKERKITLLGAWTNIFRILLYVIAFGIVVYAIPKDGKFKYEYQKGSPWKHENLIAPFDFAIYKSDKELDEERELVALSQKKYFNKNNEIQLQNTEKFLQDFNNFLFEFNGTRDSSQDFTIKGKNFIRDSRNTVYELLNNVYSNGIIENEKYINSEGENSKNVFIISENIISQKSVNEIFTPKTAYLYIKDGLGNYLKNQSKKLTENEILFIQKALPKFDFNRWIEPNLTFDEATTEKVLQDNLAGISLTRGVVQQGQRIIFQGEMVNEDEFRVLESLRREYEKSDIGSGYVYIFLGQAVIYLLLFTLIYFFLRTFRHEFFYQTKYSALILSLITVFIVLISLIIKYNWFSIWLFPFLLLPIIIKTFFDTRTGLFFHLIACVATGFIAPNSFEYFVMQFIPGYFLLITFEQINRRGLIFRSSLICFVIYTLVYVSFELMHTGIPSEINWQTIIYLAINCLLLLLAYPLIYAFEKLFGLLSDVSLVELSDSNRPLLRRLAQDAPGTFQHCMQVANLAESAIFKIGGNPHLARAGALYHDVGKLTAPMYFVENQVSGINPHDKLADNLKSAEIIINHVIKGVEIAKKYNLPKQIIDFIRTHHGTTKVMYFYKMYLKDHPEAEGDINKFTYPGPRPLSKEGAVVMMADSIEAASRSLKKYDKQTISDLVENIINNQIAQKQFDNTKLTFKDIDTIKQLFKEKLLNIYHARIEYPK